ncbi:hypothetical protein [Amedibacillus sp. YH-ame10]
MIIALVLIGGGSIYALSNNGDSATPKNAKQSETKKDEDKSSDGKTNDDTKSDEKLNDDSTSSDNQDTKKDNKSNSTSTSNTDDRKSSNESSSTDKPANGGSSTSNDNTSKPNTPNHEHSWIEQTKQEWIAPITKNEQYVIKGAWTEQVPVKEFREHEFCSGCHKDITGWAESQLIAHQDYHMDRGESSGWYSEWREDAVGYNTVNHPAEYGTRTVTVQEGYYRTITTGFKCSCGVKK